jgi:hypothetical protein
MSIGAAQAGGMAEPIMEPAVVEAATSSSSGGLVVPLLLILLIAAAASGGGGGAAAGGGGAVVSDRRVKTDVIWVGLTPEAIPVYRYRYIGLSTRFEGVMAQDVLARRPDAVVLNARGPMAVNYQKLGQALRVVH